MRVGLATAVVLAGCSFEVVPGGAPGPGGDARPDVPGGDVDNDADGVADEADNCPGAANADQRDFDGDDRGDACDGCPHLAAPTIDDADGDGIEDKCDPRPDMPGETRALWVAFETPDAIMGWEREGSWAVTNGALEQSDITYDLAYVAPAVMVMRPYVATRIRIGAYGPPTGTEPNIGASSANVGRDQYHACLLTKLAPPPVYLVSSIDAPSIQNSYTPIQWTGSTTVPIELVQETLVTNSCRADDGNIALTVTHVLGPSRAGTIALFTRLATARFDYLFVVEGGA